MREFSIAYIWGHLFVFALVVPPNLSAQITQYDAESAILIVEQNYIDHLFWHDETVERKEVLSADLESAHDAVHLKSWTTLELTTIDNIYNDGLEALTGADAQQSLTLDCLSDANQHIINARAAYDNGQWASVVQECDYAYDEMNTWFPPISWRLNKATEYLDDVESETLLLWYYAYYY